MTEREALDLLGRYRESGLDVRLEVAALIVRDAVDVEFGRGIAAALLSDCHATDRECN